MVEGGIAVAGSDAEDSGATPRHGLGPTKKVSGCETVTVHSRYGDARRAVALGLVPDSPRCKERSRTAVQEPSSKCSDATTVASLNCPALLLGILGQRFGTCLRLARSPPICANWICRTALLKGSAKRADFLSKQQLHGGELSSFTLPTYFDDLPRHKTRYRLRRDGD
jgi:hypothetical protein